jgi:hypothetical protein
MHRFTPYEIDHIRLMASVGHAGTAIAKSLDRSPQSVRVKCVELGISLRPMKARAEVRTPVEDEVWQKLKIAAKERATSVPKLVRMLLRIIVRDRLFEAVIDPPTISRPKKNTASAYR